MMLLQLNRRTVLIILVLLALIGAAVITAVQRGGQLPGQGIVPWVLSLLSSAGGIMVTAVRSDQAARLSGAAVRRVEDVHGLLDTYSEAVQELLAAQSTRAGEEVSRLLGHPAQPREFADLAPKDCPMQGGRSCCIFDSRWPLCRAAIHEGMHR